MNVRYVDDPFEEEGLPGEGGGRKPPKKLFGTTELQIAALLAVGSKRQGFRGNEQLKRFTDLEAVCAGVDPESRVQYAWLQSRIEQAKYLNRGGVIVGMDELLRRMEAKTGDMPRKKEIWITENRTRVLQRKSAEQVAETTDTPRVGVDEMEAAMQRKKSRE